MRRALLALAVMLATAPAMAQPAAPPLTAPQAAVPQPGASEPTTSQPAGPPTAPEPAALQPAAPEPRVRATLTPPQVVVGQPATLVIDVMAPNYMTKPPVMSDFQIANAITRSDSNMNFSERQADVSYAGIRYTFLISPQEPGTYAVTGQPVTITYADNPPHSRTTNVPMPATRFEAVIPDAARGLDPFLSATRLSLKQDIQPSSPSLKVGDAVTRIVTIEAEGAPAILLPPTPFVPIAGTRVYPSTPQLNDGLNQGSDGLSSTRTDRATYMLEEAGTITLPAIGIAWWDVTDEKIQRARLDPQSFTVAGGISTSKGGAEGGGLSSPRRLVLFILEHWFMLVSVIIAAALMIWATPPVVGNLKRRVQRRREMYRQSEACAFWELSRAASQNEPRQTYRALLAWLSRFEPAAPACTIKALNCWAKDPILAHETSALEHQLFATGPGAGAWSSTPLMKAIRSVRSKVAPRHRSGATTYALPKDINFQSSNVGPLQRSRPVAR